jgi:hypothetical protein
MALLAQHSDSTVENGYREDDDSDKWPIRVLHKIGIDKREIFSWINAGGGGNSMNGDKDFWGRWRC